MGKAWLRLVLFDIDGTLLLSGNLIRKVFGESFEAVTGIRAGLDGIFFAGNTDRAIFRQVMEKAGLRGDFDRLFLLFSRRFADRLREVYPAGDGPVLLPGALPLLRALKRRGFALAVATGNLRETALVKLQRFGLDRFFPAGGFGDAVESRVDVFRAALESARAHYGWAAGARGTWVVGDTPADIRGAREIGATPIAVATGPVPRADLEAAGPETLLPDLKDTRRVLSLLKET